MNIDDKKVSGLTVHVVVSNSIAESVGLKVGDLILTYNDVRTKTLADYTKAKMVKPERESMLVERNGKKLYFEWVRKEG